MITWRRLAATFLALVALAAGGTLFWYLRAHGRGMRDERGAAVPPPPRLVPATVRVRVEVLNATDTRGLARRATFVLRDAGFDVVYFGNTAERSASTVILVRSGHAEWAALAARAMHGARIEQQPDSSRFVDLTVLVGRNWAPPREPFYP